MQLLYLGKLSRTKYHEFSLKELKCWFSQYYNTRILAAKLSAYYFIYLLFNLRFIKNNNKICCRRWGCLSVSEIRDEISYRQQLSTTSFEAFELEITVNYIVHIWTENSSFVRNLTSWSVLFWLVHLTWAQGPPLLCDERGLPLPDCWRIVPICGFS